LTRSVPSGDAIGAAQRAFADTLFDELARGGLHDVVVCPGSRSTPLALAALSSPRLSVHVRLDERSAGFFALGRAIATRAPVAIVVTSGTAAAELHAAVVEADLARVPLVVLTADRPPELRGVGAPQTIDQVELYGTSVRLYEEPGVIQAASAPRWRPLASRALGAALGALPGPVHLNLAFVEPLDTAPGEVPTGRAGGAPWARRTEHARPAEPDESLEGRRVVVVAGRGIDDADAVLAAASTRGWPVLADPLSGCRTTDRVAVAGFDALARDEVLRDALSPEVVIQLGAQPASKALAEAIEAWDARVVAVEPTTRLQDPRGVVTRVVSATPGAWARAQGAGPPGPSGFLSAWRLADDAAQGALDATLATRGCCEPAVARALSAQLGDDVTLVVSSSMPVRDLEWFGARRVRAQRVVSNRGANGIDGVVSTVLGVSLGSAAVGLLGDLAFLHDAGALADALGGAAGRCVLVVVDNAGGGIFSFLPQRDTVPDAAFETLFGTPPRASVARVAEGYGAHVTAPEDLDALLGDVDDGLARGGVSVVVVSAPSRDRNVEIHRELVEAATAAAREALSR